MFESIVGRAQSLGLASTPKVKVAQTQRSDAATKAKNKPRVLQQLASKKHTGSSDSDDSGASSDDSDDDSGSADGSASDSGSGSSSGTDGTSASDSDSDDDDDEVLVKRAHHEDEVRGVCVCGFFNTV